MSAVALSDEEILRRVRETVEGRLRIGGLTPFVMRPSRGYLSLGMRDVRASPPPVPEDIERRAVNQAHAEAQKKWKDAEEAKRKRKNLEREELEKRRRQQRQDGLPVEASPSPSLSIDSSDDDDESEAGQGPLDHLPNIRGTALGASASSPVFPGGGGEDASGPTIARPEAEADMPEAWALGKRAVSPVGSTAEVEQAAAGATQLPPQRVEGAPESGEGRSTPADTEAMPPPRATAVAEEGCNAEAVVSSFEHQAKVPALAPRKALKVSTSSTAQWVVEAQAAIQRGAASARADLKEPVVQGEAIEVATKQAEEKEEPTPREAEARESDGAKAPLVTEATEGEAEAPWTSKAEATEAEAPRTTEAEVAEAGAPGTTEAEAVEASVSAAKLVAQEAETEVGQASIPPLVQGPPPLQESAREVEVHSISSDDASQGKEVADAEAASTVEQPALTSGEGSSALVWVQPEPCGWDHPRVLWRSQDDPEAEPLFALKDVAMGGVGHLRAIPPSSGAVATDNAELKSRSLGKLLFLRQERDVWDQLR
ncbi:uncharacterized protein [Miscanthus floridulus]|uniref:uncharacterized protein n=1 Tax=Miscanthus floridulus TaxID=154761 RepID=UPI003459B4D1